MLEKLTQQLDADLKKIDTERNSPPRIERVPASQRRRCRLLCQRNQPCHPRSAVTPVETASPPVEPAPPAAAPQARPEAAPQPETESAPPDEAKLRDELEANSAKLIREMHDLESLRKQLGIVNPNSDGNELRDALQARLTVVNNRLRSLNSECLTLDSQIGRLNEQLDALSSEQGKKDRAEQMLQGDGMLSFYRDELAMRVELNKRNISIDDKGLDTLDTDRRLKARREELLEAAAARDTAKAKEYRGQLVIKHRERDRVKEQVAALGLEYEELFTKLDVLSHRRPELAEMQLQVKTMTSNVDALNQQLYKISTAKRAAADQQAAADDPEQAAGARRKKQGKLQDLLNQKNDELDRDAAEVNKLRYALGVATAADLSSRVSDLQDQTTRLDGEIFDQSVLIAKSVGELDKLRLDIELAGDPAVQKGRPWEAMQYDPTLKSPDQQLQDLGAATAAVAKTPDSEDRLNSNLRAAARLESSINERREQFMARYADDDAAATLSDYGPNWSPPKGSTTTPGAIWAR